MIHTILCQQQFICWCFSNNQAGRQLLLKGNKLYWELCWMVGIQPKKRNLIYAMLASSFLFRCTFCSAPPSLPQVSSLLIWNYNSFPSLPLTVSPNPVYIPMEAPYFLKQEKECISNISIFFNIHFTWHGNLYNEVNTPQNDSVSSFCIRFDGLIKSRNVTG